MCVCVRVCVWMPTVTLHSRDVQQRPNDPSKSIAVSLSFSQHSHGLHLMTPVFNSHHLLSVFISFLISAFLIFLFPTHQPSIAPGLTSFYIISSSSLFLSHRTVWKSCQIWRDLTTLLIYFKKKSSEPHTLKVRVQYS